MHVCANNIEGFPSLTARKEGQVRSFPVTVSFVLPLRISRRSPAPPIAWLTMVLLTCVVSILTTIRRMCLLRR